MKAINWRYDTWHVINPDTGSTGCGYRVKQDAESSDDLSLVNCWHCKRTIARVLREEGQRAEILSIKMKQLKIEL